MKSKEYWIVRQALGPVLMLGNIDPGDVSPIAELQFEADRRHSITLQLQVLQRLFRKDVQEEK